MKTSRLSLVRHLGARLLTAVRLTAVLIVIENPFAGFVVGWTWAEHRAAGFDGGTDYVMYPPDTIRAAANGRVTLAAGQNGFTPGNAIILALADGRKVNYREVASTAGMFPRTVSRDEVIGHPNKASRWPHIDATVGGVRVPFEPLVNLGLDPSGGGGTPVFDKGDIPVTVYADGGPGPVVNPAPSSFWIGSPGSWVHIDNTKLGANYLAIIVAAFNQPITMFTADLTAVGNVWLSMGSATGGVTQAQVQAISDASDAKTSALFTSLWTAISSAFTSVLKAFVPLATSAQVVAMTPVAVPTVDEIAVGVRNKIIAPESS